MFQYSFSQFNIFEFDDSFFIVESLVPLTVIVPPVIPQTVPEASEVTDTGTFGSTYIKNSGVLFQLKRCLSNKLNI
ncbi:hypothetical protein AYI69_g8357 [Smittium culicis]|uniref:Uncharacterized protein n=1 Tax=Smittium culicis TaxID=133412 RepID=A0A1R1XK11_9FUNG|nr:hypothetical protein AYI69_g8357 [Smittium culicis]